MSLARIVLYSGTTAGFACLAALAIAARCESRGALQPINATSHWIYGETAATVKKADLRRTGLGALTNVGAAIFWSVPFALWVRAAPLRHPVHLGCAASAVSAFAAFFDYAVVPKRLRPGWERAVSLPSIAAAFAAMAGGMAFGAWLAQGPRQWERLR